jgi:hypothetical protein
LSRVRVRVFAETLLENKAVKKISKKWIDYCEIKKVKKLIQSIRSDIRENIEMEATLTLSTVLIQRIVRGCLGRRSVVREYLNHRSVNLIQRFLWQAKRRKMTLNVVIRCRVRIRKRNIEDKKAALIQALIRRYLSRCWFLKRQKRLVREKMTREKKIKAKAACGLQTLFRVVLSKKIVARRRKEKIEDDEIAFKFEELECKLEGMHSDYLKDLLVIRAQSGVRALIAKKEFLKKSSAVLKQTEVTTTNRLTGEVLKIQSLARGYLSRKEYKAYLPYLQNQAQKRIFCVECEKFEATRRCLDCKDRYCNNCFLKLHKKGVRKNHSWLPTTTLTPLREAILQSVTATTYGTNNTDKTSANKNGQGWTENQDWGQEEIAGKTTISVEWEEYFDESAQAKYWFNSQTGEASWISPFTSTN